MAEVLANDEAPTSQPQPSKAGRHSRFTPEEDIAILREVSAANAHISAFGEARQRYQDAANNINATVPLAHKVTWKTVRDCYKRMQENFDRNDNTNRRMSGVGGQIGQMDELLMAMREARDDLNTEKTARKTAKVELDRRKDAVGEALVARSLKRAASASASDEDSIIGSAKKLRQSHIGHGDEDMEHFTAQLGQVDMARVNLDRERMDFEGERCAIERAEREQDRVERREEAKQERSERREERLKQQELELEKFKLLLEAFAKK